VNGSESRPSFADRFTLSSTDRSYSSGRVAFGPIRAAA
jgi:hypothetical protein